MKIVYKIAMYTLSVLAISEAQAYQRRWTPAEAERRAKTGKFDPSDKDQLLADLPTEWKKHHRSTVRRIEGGDRVKSGEIKEAGGKKVPVTTGGTSTITREEEGGYPQPEKFVKEEELELIDFTEDTPPKTVDCKYSQDINLDHLSLLKNLTLEDLSGEMGKFDKELYNIMTTENVEATSYRFFLMDVYLYNKSEQYKLSSITVDESYGNIFNAFKLLMESIYCKINKEQTTAVEKIKEWRTSALAVINKTEQFLKKDTTRWDGTDKGKSHQATIDNLKKLFS